MKKLLILLLIFPLILWGYCSEPSAPYGKPTKPSVPYCINEYSRTHTCSEWEFNNYVSDVENYKYDAENYIRKLKNYLEEAQDYVQCQIRSME